MNYDTIEKLQKFPQINLKDTVPLLMEIEQLCYDRNAVILAHNYMTPDIYFGVASIVGDSLELAKQAAKTKADVIVLAGVHFMAETAKLLNPSKTVLIPDVTAGCSLADSITALDVINLRNEHPGVPIVTYINTSAAVKAECDITCTSGNAVEVVKSLGVDKVIVVPDEYLALWIAEQVPEIEIINYKGHCQVHKEFTKWEIKNYREIYEGLVVIAHPECPPEVLAEADFTGSTAKMSAFVKDKQPNKVLLVTECSMSDNVSGENTDVEFIRPCHFCPHMKKITLENIRYSLLNMSPEVVISSNIAKRARLAVEKMMAL
jgi:quinolinate synthase